MRLIHITGRSGSGKTTLIRNLLPLITPLGTVAVIKHTAHHDHHLTPGKDTSYFVEGGATIVAGVGRVRTFIICQETSPEAILASLCTTGIPFCIIEGYKSLPLPKVLLGDFEGGPSVLKNPQPEAVIAALPSFDQFMTLPAMLAEVARRYTPGADRESRVAMVAQSLAIHGLGDQDLTDYYESLIKIRTYAGEISRAVQHFPRSALLTHVWNGKAWSGGDRLFLVAAGRRAQEAEDHAAMAVKQICTWCRENLPGVKVG